MNSLSLRNQNIDLIYLLGENGQYILSKENFSQEDPFQPQDIYRELLETPLENKMISLLANESLYNQEYVVSIARKVRGLSSFTPKGILGIELNATALEQLWNIAQFKNGTSLWIFDENNRIVYHPNQSLLGETIHVNLQAQFQDDTNHTFTEEWEGKEMIFYSAHSPQTNWTLVAMTPSDIVYEPIDGMKRKVVIALASSFLVALIVSTGFARSIVNPLRRIQKGMKKTEIGEWRNIKPLKGTDEISSVVSSYNKMVQKLSTLVEDLSEAEIKHHKVLFEKKEYRASSASVTNQSALST